LDEILYNVEFFVFAEIMCWLITYGLANRSSPTLTTPKCIIVSKSYHCYKQMNWPPKCQATPLQPEGSQFCHWGPQLWGSTLGLYENHVRIQL